MLKSIQLTNFRNYADQQFDFEKVTVFIGLNGVGKTNILEAVSFLALARSWRTRHDKEVIRWGEDVARLVGQTETDIIEIALTNQTKSGKVIKVNGVNRRSIDLLGHLTVILFLPESLSLVDGPPHLRRQFIDLLLIQHDRRYAYHLLQLQKVLRQRNRLLRQINDGEADPAELAFWNESLTDHGSYLIVERVKALRAMNETLARYYQTMSQKEGNLWLQYKVAAVSESAGEQEKYAQPTNCPIEREVWTKILAETLKKYQHREISSGASLYGPQRDDFNFILHDRPLSGFGSRGEFRSAVLALKAAEADYLLNADTEGESRTLLFLLDDVYSELDEQRRGQLAALIGDHQAIITTTDLSHLDPIIQEQGKIVEL